MQECVFLKILFFWALLSCVLPVIEASEYILSLFNFLRAINAEILDANLIDVGSILDDYFGIKPPFENSEKKKSELPDAFIAQQINKRFGETEKVMLE